MSKTKWIIVDWANNIMYGGQEFKTFDDGEEFLSEQLGDAYEEERGEYYVITYKEWRDKGGK